MAKKSNTNPENDSENFSTDEYLKQHKSFDKIPTIFLNDMVIYPGMSIPVTITSMADYLVAKKAKEEESEIFIVTKRSQNINPNGQAVEISFNEDGTFSDTTDTNPVVDILSTDTETAETETETNNETETKTKAKASEKKSKLETESYDVGVIAKVFRIDCKEGYENDPTEEAINAGAVDIYVHTMNAAQLRKISTIKPHTQSSVKVLPEIYPDDQDIEMPVIMQQVSNTYNHILEVIGVDETTEVKKALKAIGHPLARLNFISINSPLDIASKQDLLETRSIKERAQKLALALNLSAQLVDLKANIAKKTSQVLTQQQKEHFLRQQINAMQEELGGGSIEDEELDELDARANTKDWNNEVRAHFNKEMRKLERFNASSPEYGIQYGYLETMLNLPWNTVSEDNFSIPNVEKILDRDHYGLEKVKERIVEQVAVMKLRKDMKAPILCLYGPPGVGKTSLGKSIADALGRKYVRVALGGVHDESEIRGHRKTYVGAMPGRIISAMEKSGTSNPVFVLDEIDKIGRDMKGDPSTALLEVLDPEQNNKFHDNYLDIDYDLSKVMFIATANNLETISRPLRDRMEIIEITGYVTEEKIAIAKKHLIPKILKEHGLGKTAIKFSDEAILQIIDKYTRESGVRLLEKTLSKAVRKLAVKKARGQRMPKEVTTDMITDLLGAELVHPDSWEENMPAGVATGLAWTAVGGEILFIETSLTPGKGDKLLLTGQLGDVMKESATIAIQYLKAHASYLGIDASLFDAYNIHLHVPEGAIPKDGPSAGITMIAALASAFTRRKLKPRIAMTGEITLRGKVLPVGGIKEKILAAKRATCNTIVLCKDNKRDIEEIKQTYIEGMHFQYVETIEQVIDFVLTDEIDTNLPPLEAPKK